MEELQDAIEDAQYMNAMHDDIPKPTKEWKFPTEEEKETYITNTLAKHPDAFEAESVCQGSLGLYLFMKYCSRHGDISASDFIMELANYRLNTATHQRMDAAILIKDGYLVHGSTGNPNAPKHPNLFRQFKPISDPPSDFHQFIHPDEPSSSATNVLHLCGQYLDAVLTILNGQDAASKKSNEGAAKDLFDILDFIVFSSLKERHYTKFKASELYVKYFQFMILSEQKVTEDDFTLFRVLGRGGFGMVNGCKKSTTGKLYAMKMMNKKRIKMRKSEALCINERNILAMVDSKFIVCLKYAFTTPSDLYLILDLMTGGDLGFHLCRKGRFSVPEAKYYAARVLLGLAAMHELEIVYRDLKPENILMDEDGRTKISDLGLACRVPQGGQSGTCGTRGYWAPEMLRRDAQGRKMKYTKSVDWFSYGCCVYEFLYGSSPFRSERAKTWGGHDKKEKEKAMDQATLEMDPEYPQFFDNNAKDLCSKLLIKDGSKRLGAKGPSEVMCHPWFGDIDWENFIADRTPPPLKPAKDINMATQSEIGSFADEKTSKKIELTEADQKIYDGWEFVSVKAFQEEVVQFMRYEDISGPIVPLVHNGGCCVLC